MKIENEHVILFEIKKGKGTKWKKWCQLLRGAYRHEVERSLAEEKVEHEMFISFELNGKIYGLAYMKGDCLPSNQTRAVNRIHREKTKECLERVSQANIMYSAKIDPISVYSTTEW